MGDRKRFHEFGKLISQQFPHVKRIADIAGGKGYLNLNLTEKGYYVDTFDGPFGARVRSINYYHRFFDSSIKSDYDLLIGMHPDQATDLILFEAKRRKIAFAIVPCCVYPNKFLFNRNQTKPKIDKYELWLNHLITIAQKLDFVTSVHELKIQGRNIAILGRLYK